MQCNIIFYLLFETLKSWYAGAISLLIISSGVTMAGNCLLKQLIIRIDFITKCEKFILFESSKLLSSW